MQPAYSASRFCFAVLAIGFAAFGQTRVSGGIVVEGVSDRQVANGPVRIRVSQTATAAAEHRLDGQRIPAGVWLDVTAPGYHELRSMELPLGKAEEHARLVRFVIQSARGHSEWALPPWTPLTPVASGQVLEPGAGKTVRLKLFMPTRFPVGLQLPVVAMVMDAQAKRVNFTGTLVGSAGITLKRGVGSGLLALNETEPIHFKAGPLFAGKTITIDNGAWQTVQGDIKKTTTWKSDAHIHVTSSLTVAQGATLTIRNGCVVKLAPKVEVTVHGRLIIDGTETAPVVFCPESPETPWGGVTLMGATAAVEAKWAFVTGSGGNPWWFVANNVAGTHRNEQAAFFLGKKAVGMFSDCFFIDNLGQAFHGEEAQFTLDRCVIQRCLTVGQFNGGSVIIRDSALLDFPGDDRTFVDGDNDALYFTLG